MKNIPFKFGDMAAIDFVGMGDGGQWVVKCRVIFVLG